MSEKERENQLGVQMEAMPGWEVDRPGGSDRKSGEERPRGVGILRILRLGSLSWPRGTLMIRPAIKSVRRILRPVNTDPASEMCNYALL